MPLRGLLNLPVTLVRRTASVDTTEFGDEIPGEEEFDTVGELQQLSRSEPATAGELSVTTYLLVLPAGSRVRTGDAVLADGFEYEVVGDPAIRRNPRTRREELVEATLTLTRAAEDES